MKLKWWNRGLKSINWRIFRSENRKKGSTANNNLNPALPECPCVSSITYLMPSNRFSRSRSCGSRQLWYNRLETMNARQMSKFSSPSSNEVILVISCSPNSMVKGDKARADEIMETGLDAGRDDGRDPDRDRDIVCLVLIHTKSKPREQESSFLSDVYSIRRLCDRIQR